MSPDYGLGIGRGFKGGGPDSILADPRHKVYPIHSLYGNFREKVYKKVAPNLFLGAGMSFEIRRNIDNKDSASNTTPSGIYNSQHGLPQDRYSANGFLFNVEYTLVTTLTAPIAAYTLTPVSASTKHGSAAPKIRFR